MAADVSGPRSALLAFNTVERLLLGDYFHAVGLPDLTGALAAYPPDWVVCGLGTTNWYRRNGEVVVEGEAGAPRVWWADPLADPPARVLDLLTERPAPDGRLTSPSYADGEAEPRLPFVAVAVAEAGTAVAVALREGEDLRDVVLRACEDRNLGLVGVRAPALVATVDHQSACHLPLGGAGSLDGAESVRGVTGPEPWSLAGLYSANPTVQAVVSAPGSPLHLHGHAGTSRVGGHVRQVTATRDGTVELLPLRDLVVRIRDLDTATLPVRPLA